MFWQVTYKRSYLFFMYLAKKLYTSIEACIIFLLIWAIVTLRICWDPNGCIYLNQINCGEFNILNRTTLCVRTQSHVYTRTHTHNLHTSYTLAHTPTQIYISTHTHLYMYRRSLTRAFCLVFSINGICVSSVREDK